MRIVRWIVACACAWPAAGQTWLAADEFGAAALVVSDGDEAARNAAAILQDYWERVSSHRPPIAATPPEGAKTIRLGLDPSSLGEQELRIKTRNADSLAIEGGSALGLEFAVYQFIEDRLGVRWLAPETTHIPAAPQDIPWIDFRYAPPFEYRWSTYLMKVDGIDAFRRAHRWNMGPGFSAHTVYALVPPEKHFPENPEYFSEINGQRVAPWDIDYHDWDVRRAHPERMAQLCMTHPGVIALITERIRERIAQNPAQRVHHVSQEDWANFCTCPRCAEIDAAEESHAGAYIYGLNQIADNIAESHPGYAVETLAYQFTRKPPKNLRPVDNLYIKLCSIECDFARPLDDPESRSNIPFAEDIRGWSAVAPRLHVWDYTTNFRNFQRPLPNFDVLQRNMRFYAAHKVRAMYPQGSYDAGAEFAHLKSYLVAKLLWNPYIDIAAVQDEFLALYYGPAADHVARYIDLLDAEVERQDAVVGCFDEGSWYDADLVQRAEALFAEAYAAAGADAELRLRLDRLYATVQFAALVCPPVVTEENGALVMRRPPSPSLEDYTERLKANGVVNIVDFFPFEELYRQIGEVTPPREERTPLTIIENDAALLWIAPEKSGSIVRWRDKRTGAELLRGYERFGHFPALWQEWESRPSVAEGPLQGAYAVTALEANAATLEATLDNGLRLRRTLTLTGDGVAGEWTFANPSAEPLPCKVKIHPEFWAQGKHIPEIWLRGAQGWRRHPGATGQSGPLQHDRFPAEGLDAMAAYLAEPDLRIETHIQPEGVGDLMYFFHVDGPGQQINLEIVADPAPIPPGESRRIRAEYRVARGRPAP